MPAADTVYRLRTRGRLNGQRVEFGVHFTRPAGTSPLSNLTAAWVASTMPLVIAATSSSVNWDDLLISDVNIDGAEQVIFPLTQPNPGSVTGDCLPGQNAMLVSLHTGQKSRRRRGRLFLPGASESFSANGILTGTQLTAVQAFAAGLVAQYGPGGSIPVWRLCIYSPIDTTPPPVRPFKPKENELITAVNSARTDEVIRTQRRRSIGTGI